MTDEYTCAECGGTIPDGAMVKTRRRGAWVSVCEECHTMNIRLDNFRNCLNLVCKTIEEECDLSKMEIADLIAHLPGELREREENRNEDAYMRQQERLMESGGIDDSTYRKQMKDAGRGRQLR